MSNTDFTKKQEFLLAVRALPEWEQDKLFRFLFMLKNKSPRAQRYMDMFNKGQMSKVDVLRAI